MFSTPRMMTVWTVLESALDCEDALVVAACRRLIVANRRGWKRHAQPNDKALVWVFAE